MEENKMLDKLTKLVQDYTGDDSLVLTEKTALISDLGLSSLDIVNLSCEIEDEFNVEIPDRAIKDLKTVGDIINFVNSL